MYKITPDNIDEAPTYVAAFSEPSVLAENVTGFHVDVTELSSTGKARIAVSMEQQGYSSELQDSVKLRNKVISNTPGYDFQDLNTRKRVQVTIIAPESIASGTSVKLTCSITGYVLNTEIAWSFAEGSAEDAKASVIDSNGVLHARGNGLLVIKAVALGDPSDNSYQNKASAEVTILVK